jgi:ketosteroid isomerase-like protein
MGLQCRLGPASQRTKEGEAVDEQGVAAWLDRYSRAWGTYDQEEIGALFSEDAVYFYNPFDDPARGREAIVASWLEEPDEPGTYEGSYRPVLVAGDQAVARGYSRYLDTNGTVANEFDNLFLLRFDADGRCAEYREWYMEKPEPDAA